MRYVLPVGKIVVELKRQTHKYPKDKRDMWKKRYSGRITSDLKQRCPDCGSYESCAAISSCTFQNRLDGVGRSKFNACIDGIESLILAHACLGIDITSVYYIEGIKTAIDAIGNNIDD
jgi:hypothetical protein